jgi:hypothetical protein
VNSGSLTLEGNGSGNLILDGGAVWNAAGAGIPAQGAANTGLAATDSLVYVSGGAFTMNTGVALQNNSASSNGGGVSLSNAAVFNMLGGTIRGNKATNTAGGGGVLVSAQATFTMSGGTISGNFAASGSGKGVYAGGTFNMSDSAVVDSNNDVYLLNNKTITITGNLVTGAAATITPQTYTVGTQVLADNSYITANYAKFAVTPDGLKTWYIDGAGKLANPLAITVFSPTGSGTPVANWSMPIPADHLGINKVVIKYQYWDAPSVIITETYGWDESLNSGLGGLTNAYSVDPSGRNFVRSGESCAFNFPRPSMLTPLVDYCFFAVEVEDRFGMSASGESPGFGTGKARIVGGAAYATLKEAVDAASGTAGISAVIELLADIQFPETGVTGYTIAGGKYIKLTVPANQTRTVKRVTGGTSAVFKLEGGASLTLEGTGTGSVILDGGAVWTGGTATPPSPASGATNTGITANGPLVWVADGTFTMNAGSVLKNNDSNAWVSGGGVCLNAGTFTMAGGTIINNNYYYTPQGSNGGGVFNNGGVFVRSSGLISGNKAGTAGGGLYTGGWGVTTGAGVTISGNSPPP